MCPARWSVKGLCIPIFALALEPQLCYLLVGPCSSSPSPATGIWKAAAPPTASSAARAPARNDTADAPAVSSPASIRAKTSATVLANEAISARVSGLDMDRIFPTASPPVATGVVGRVGGQ